jgi:hypothetical protein
MPAERATRAERAGYPLPYSFAHSSPGDHDMAVYVALGVAVLVAAWGTAGAVIWRHRGGKASDGFLIGALFAMFGVAYTALATPRAPGDRRLSPRRDRPRMGAPEWLAVAFALLVIAALLVLATPRPGG